jgi:tape measure domain-containing protein
LQFLDQAVDALGLNVRSSSEGFKLWAGSTRGTELAGQKTRDIFWAVSEASTAMQLSGDDSKGVLLALSQMMSKGKVSAEELRGQMGEIIPGAFGLAAKSIGVSEAQLDKMLQKGELMSSEFLPKFAAELHKTFGGAAVTQSQSATANFNRMGTEIHRLKRTIGEELLPTATALITGVLIPSVSWIGQNIEVIGFLTVAIGSSVLAFKTYNVVMGISKVVTMAWTGQLWAMNAALWANPVGLVVAGIVGLAAAVIYAWNKFAGFRGFLFGMWEVMKDTGSLIYNTMVAPMLGFGKILMGVMTFDTGLIERGLKQSAEALDKSIFGKGIDLGKSYKKGC